MTIPIAQVPGSGMAAMLKYWVVPDPIAPPFEEVSVAAPVVRLIVYSREIPPVVIVANRSR
jgi:hypothetical protein